MDKYKITAVFTEPMLGTVPKSKEIYAQFVQSRAVDLDPGLAASELETVQEVEEQGWTGFHTLEDGTPFVYDYLVRGFLKAACGALRRVEGTRSNKLIAYKKKIDQLVFVFPRRISLALPDGQRGRKEIPIYEERTNLKYDPDFVPSGNRSMTGDEWKWSSPTILVKVGTKIVETGKLGVLERPLRASTPQGERVTLVRSDTVPVGTAMEFEVHILGAISEAQLKEWFDYARYCGFGQWRSGSYGRADVTVEKIA